MKFKMTSDKGKPQKNENQKETTFVGMLFQYANKISFPFRTNYNQLFYAFLDEIDTSQSPGTSRCTNWDHIK